MIAACPGWCSDDTGHDYDDIEYSAGRLVREHHMDVGSFIAGIPAGVGLDYVSVAIEQSEIADTVTLGNVFLLARPVIAVDTSHVALTPGEARVLASLLVSAAEAVERIEAVE